MTPEEMKLLWKPWTVFNNILHVDALKKSDKMDLMAIIPNIDFNFTRDDKTNMHNTRLFNGARNKIHYERQYTVTWICHYNMRWYPFDSQRCAMEFFPNDLNLNLIPESVHYSGPMVLPQHTVISTHICSAQVANRPGVIVEVVLQRPLIGTVLTVFVPTGIILLISQMVSVFSVDYLDMVIEVNLTLLLVLATL